jgi:hypothetical protein
MSQQHAKRKMDWSTRLWIALVVAAGLGLIGCSGRPALFPNSDPTLRKSSTKFAADSATRFPYKADAPKAGDAVARAEISYTLKHIFLVNLSDEPWSDFEVWANGSHVVFVKGLPKGEHVTLNFQMLYDGEGEYFPIAGKQIDKLEILRDGKMYNVPIAHPE